MGTHPRSAAHTGLACSGAGYSTYASISLPSKRSCSLMSKGQQSRSHESRMQAPLGRALLAGCLADSEGACTSMNHECCWPSADLLSAGQLAVIAPLESRQGGRAEWPPTLRRSQAASHPTYGSMVASACGILVPALRTKRGRDWTRTFVPWGYLGLPACHQQRPCLPA